MIAYTVTITRGCIHTPFIEVKIGTLLIGMKCAELREFIRMANEIGLYQALEQETDLCTRTDVDKRELLTFIYEEFKDSL